MNENSENPGPGSNSNKPHREPDSTPVHSSSYVEQTESRSSDYSYMFSEPKPSVSRPEDESASGTSQTAPTPPVAPKAGLAASINNPESRATDNLAKARQIRERSTRGKSDIPASPIRPPASPARTPATSGTKPTPAKASRDIADQMKPKKPNVPLTGDPSKLQNSMLDAKKAAPEITKGAMAGAEKAEASRKASAQAVKDAAKNNAPRPSALKGIKGSAVNAAKSYQPAKARRADGSNDTAKNAKNTVATGAAKGAVLGAIKGAATGGWAGAAAGAAKGAATGTATGSKKAAAGAAGDVAKNAMSGSKDTESTEASGKVGKGATFAIIAAFSVALISGTIGGTQQSQQQYQPNSAGNSSCEKIVQASDTFGNSLPGTALVSSVTAIQVPMTTTKWNPEQIGYVKTMIGVSKSVNFGKEGATIAVMTSIAESTIRNLKYGDAVGPDSRGLFQQRYLGDWGSEEDISNPAYATQAFFFGAGTNPGLASYKWKEMEPWVAAQKVQRSAFSDGRNYKPHYEDAKALVEKYWDQSPGVTPITGHAKLNPPGEIVSVQTPVANCDETSTTPVVAGGGVGKNDYPAATAPYCRVAAGCPWIYGIEAGYSIQCANNVAGGCRGECVDWAGWRALQKMDAVGKFKIVWGNAEQWDDKARANGHTVDRTPEVGALVNWEAGYGGTGAAGHIATISQVNPDGTFNIEEYNYGFGENATKDPMMTGTPGRYHTRDNLKMEGGMNVIHINSTKGFSPV